MRVVGRRKVLDFSTGSIFISVQGCLTKHFMKSAQSRFFLRRVIGLLFYGCRFVQSPRLCSGSRVSRDCHSYFESIISGFPRVFSSGARVRLSSSDVGCISSGVGILSLRGVRQSIVKSTCRLFVKDTVGKRFKRFFAPGGTTSLLMSFITPGPRSAMLSLTYNTKKFLASTTSCIRDGGPSASVHTCTRGGLCKISGSSFLTHLKEVELTDLCRATSGVFYTSDLV